MDEWRRAIRDRPWDLVPVELWWIKLERLISGLPAVYVVYSHWKQPMTLASSLCMSRLGEGDTFTRVWLVHRRGRKASSVRDF